MFNVYTVTKALLASLVVLFSAAAPAFAYNSGITGRTTSGCGGGGCHSSGSTTAVSLTGNNPVNPNTQTTLTVVVAHSGKSHAGINLGIVNSSGTNSGTIGSISGQGTSVSGSELIHTSKKAMSGNSASFQFNWTSPATPGIYNIRAAGNAVDNNGNSSNDEFALLSNATIVVKGITIGAPNGGQTWCTSTAQQVTWTSYGVTNVNIELSDNGGTSYSQIGTASSTDGSSNSWTWNIPSTQTAGTQYRIRVVDASSSSILSASAANFSIIQGAAITTQPQAPSGSLCEGQALQLSVVAAGSGLTYQWTKDATDIAGQTSSTLNIASLTSTSSGSYAVKVGSSCGSQITSNAVAITVNPLPSITTQPTLKSVCVGGSTTFSVAATGGNILYQWQKNGTNIAGATSSTFAITSAVITDTAAYRCVVTNSCGSVNSNAATLFVSETPSITSSPQSAVQCEGTNLTLTSGYSGAGLHQLQWLKNGSPVNNDNRITGAQTTTLSITGITSADAGDYKFQVTSNACTTQVSSNAAAISIGAKPTITAQSQSQTMQVGAVLTLSVTSTGSNLLYEWSKNGTFIAGATNATFSIPSIAKADSGTYSVKVVNDCGTATSQNIVIKISDAPAPNLELSSLAIDFGTVQNGSNATTKVLTVRNKGNAVLNVEKLIVRGSRFTLSETEAFTVAAGGSKDVTITFTPTAVGSVLDTIDVNTNASNTNVLLTANVVANVITLNTTSLEFGSIETEVGASRDTVLQLCNKGTSPIVINAITLTGADAASFTITPPNQLPVTVPVDGCIDVAVRFSPTREGTHTAALKVMSTDAEASVALMAMAKKVTSVVDVEYNTLHVAPNPVQNEVTISLPTAETAQTLMILDVQGVVVFSQQVQNQSSFTWNTRTSNGNAVASGVYTVVVRSANAASTARVSILR